MVSKKISPNSRYDRIKKVLGNPSDTELAARLKVSKQAVSQWKKGDGPGDTVLIRVAATADVPLEWLRTGEDLYLKGEHHQLRVRVEPQHGDLARTLDMEFKRVADEEGILLEDLVTEVAELLGIDARNIYNYRTGKWPIPASILPHLCVRFRSTAILKEVLGEHIEAAIKPLLDGLEKQMLTLKTKV